MGSLVHHVSLVLVLAFILVWHQGIYDCDCWAQIRHHGGMFIGHVIVGGDEHPAILQLSQGEKKVRVEGGSQPKFSRRYGRAAARFQLRCDALVRTGVNDKEAMSAIK